MKTRIAGIPCEVRLTHCLVTKGNYSLVAETPDEYYGLREVEFDVYDKKGYRASWLEALLTDGERQRIGDALIKETEGEME